MGRPQSGRVRYVAGRWVGLVPLPCPDGWPAGKEPPMKVVPFPELTENTEEARALAVDARLNAIKLMRSGEFTESSKETVADYANTWLESREGKIASIRDDRGQIKHHILPVIGPMPLTKVRRTDIENVVAALDKKVTKNEIAAKTAKNIWGVVTKLFDDATNAKEHTGLRRLKSNPCDGVRGPDDDGPDKLLQFLYPSEFLKFMACADVPLSWRRNVAIAVYLCLRDGEQRALRWANVDFEHGLVRIAEVYDRRAEETRDGTKANAGRYVPIHPHLMPVLRALKSETKGKGTVCLLPSERDMARGLRRWLKRAGVTRAELHATTATSKQIRWHDLRATGLTWMAVAGKSAVEIRDVAGHTQTSMTDRYMRAAAILRGGRFGEVFPPLPIPDNTGQEEGETQANYLKLQRGGRDSKEGANTPISQDNPEFREPLGNVPKTPEAPTSGNDDPVTAALAAALTAASVAQRWDIVGQLAKELEARRTGRSAE